MPRDRIVELVHPQKDLFWVLSVNKNRTSVQAGRVGSAGRKFPFTVHENQANAHNYANSLVQKKKKEGYVVPSQMGTMNHVGSSNMGASRAGNKRRGDDSYMNDDEDDDTDSVASSVSQGHYGKRRQYGQDDSDHDTESIASTDSIKARHSRWHGVSPLNRRRSLRLAQKNGEETMETGWCPPIELLTRKSTTADLRIQLGMASLQSQATVQMSDPTSGPPQAKLQRMETSGKWSGWRNKPQLMPQDTVVMAASPAASKKPSRLSKRLSTKMETIAEHSVPLKPSLLKKTSTTAAIRKNLASTKLETLKTMKSEGLIAVGKLPKSRSRKIRFDTDDPKSVFKTFSFRSDAPSTSGVEESETSKRGVKRRAGSHAVEQTPKTPTETPDYSLSNNGSVARAGSHKNKLLQRQSSLAIPKGLVHCPAKKLWPLSMVGQIVWQVPLTTHGMAVHVEETRCFVGDESGTVIQLDSTATPVNVMRLPSGVKCLVEDDGFIYAACNDSQIYDVTHGDARCVSHVRGFGELYAVDIHHGVVAISDEHGNVATVSHAGETVWQRKSSGEFGWMVYVDASGIYHGHSAGITKYSQSGDILWNLAINDGVLAGVQTEDHLYAASGAKVLKICKASGHIVQTYDKGKSHSRNLQSVAVGSGVVFGGGHKIVIYDEATGDVMYVCTHRFTPASIRYFCGRLFCIGTDALCVLDFCKETIENALNGLNVNTVDVIPPAQMTSKLKRQSTVVQSKPPADGILVECIKGKSRKGALKVKTRSVGHNKQWDIQFPAELCQEGSKFIVKELKPCATGHYYRVNGPIYEALV